MVQVGRGVGAAVDEQAAHLEHDHDRVQGNTQHCDLERECARDDDTCRDDDEWVEQRELAADAAGEVDQACDDQGVSEELERRTPLDQGLAAEPEGVRDIDHEGESEEGVERDGVPGAEGGEHKEQAEEDEQTADHQADQGRPLSGQGIALRQVPEEHACRLLQSRVPGGARDALIKPVPASSRIPCPGSQAYAAPPRGLSLRCCVLGLYGMGPA